MAGLLPFAGLSRLSAQQLTVAQAPQRGSIEIALAGPGGPAKGHLLQLDDTPAFVAPMLTQRFEGSLVQLLWRDVAMVPGLTYYVRVDGGETQSFRLLPEHRIDLPPQDISCRTLRHTWEASGRFDVGTALSGLSWVGDRWVVRPHTFLPGESLYNVESIVRPAIVGARYCGDMATLNDLALYYLEMLTQTETVSSISARGNLTQETRLRLQGIDGAARTFSASFGKEAGEGELYNAQWLYPAALLVRVVTTLPIEKQTAAMREFATSYATFVVRDQLLRYLFQEQMPALGGRPVAGRVARWMQAMSGAKGAEPWDSDLSDIDLWLLASTVQVLGAHANAPALVPVDSADLTNLREALKTGLKFLGTRQTLHPETKKFTGRTVASATYFDGEYSTHADMAYSAVGGETIPSPAMRKGLPDVSWDSSHVYRLAVLFRALYENRKVLMPGAYPSTSDIGLLINQYVYRVFNGDYEHPLFRNYFDGSDGWFRVDYNGTGTGTPPSQYCDMRNAKRPCLTNGELRGWGELAFLNPDLERLETSLIAMAFQNNADTKSFRDRYYFSGSPFQRNVVDGFDTYGGLLYGVIAENANLISRPSQVESTKQSATAADASRNSAH